jgi:hypothetical protein
MFTAPRIVPNPESTSPVNHRSPPTPGECSSVLSGTYANQPKSAAPPGVKKPSTTTVPPNANSQYATAFSRGNATSGAPIWIGTTQLAKPNSTGVANSSSMIVPCIVNSWLYCSYDSACIPGWASSNRISNAIAPPIRKKMKAVTV